jgi:hypothetical protein
MLHPSEMKGLVLPSTTVQRSSRLPRFSAVFWYAVGPFPASCEPPKDDWPGWHQIAIMFNAPAKPQHEVPGMFCRHGSGTHANIKPTESTSAPPPMARRNIRGFAIACSCHFTTRPRPPTGWAWQCFGNPPRDRPRHRVSRLRSQRDTWLSAKQPKRDMAAPRSGNATAGAKYVHLLSSLAAVDIGAAASARRLSALNTGDVDHGTAQPGWLAHRAFYPAVDEKGSSQPQRDIICAEAEFQRAYLDS